MSVFAVWMWPQSVRESGAQAVVSRCVRFGVTDIYFLTKGLAGTTSYLSGLAPACCGRDLLRELLDAAHACGVRVHAWLTSASDEHYKAIHPESGRCHFSLGRNKGLISITDASYLLYMEKIVRELCRRYDIDGLHLDYIRYNHLLYGWGDEDLARYAASGADIARLKKLMEETFCRGEENRPECIFDAFRAGDASVLALAKTRRRDVARFASALIAAAREEKPSLLISAALMPEGAYADTAFSDLHYGQNYHDAAALYDYALPMAYSKAYEKDSLWVRSVAEGTLSKGLKTIMGLHAYDGGTGPSLMEDIAALKQTAVEGVCLFREGTFALAYAEGRAITLVNALERPIIGVSAGMHAEAIAPAAAILPGEEWRVTLPSPPDVIRVFTAEAEACVYLVK